MKKKISQTKNKFRILIANGVNLDLLGNREPEIYGTTSLKDYESELDEFAARLREAKIYRDFTLEFFQTNDEADLLQRLSEKWDGCVINPGAWTHTSLALADRLKGLGLAYVEVHISNTMDREPIRRQSLTAAHSRAVIIGAGAATYRIGLVALLETLM